MGVAGRGSYACYLILSPPLILNVMSGSMMAMADFFKFSGAKTSPLDGHFNINAVDADCAHRFAIRTSEAFFRRGQATADSRQASASFPRQTIEGFAFTL